MKYDVAHLGAGSFEFRTIRGAGHMVPTDAPLQALYILGHLIGTDFDNTLPSAASEASASCEASKAMLREYTREYDILLSFFILAVIGFFAVIYYLYTELRTVKHLFNLQVGDWCIYELVLHIKLYITLYILYLKCILLSAYSYYCSYTCTYVYITALSRGSRSGRWLPPQPATKPHTRDLQSHGRVRGG